MTKVTAADAETNDLFGIAVGISGNQIICGANGNDDAGESSGSAYIFSSETASIAEITKQNISVYPNPSTNVIQIETEENIKQVEVCSLEGKKLFVSTTKTIDVSDLNQGLYILQITTSKGISSQLSS